MRNPRHYFIALLKRKLIDGAISDFTVAELTFLVLRSNLERLPLKRGTWR